jgi:hypothetical protein
MRLCAGDVCVVDVSTGVLCVVTLVHDWLSEAAYAASCCIALKRHSSESQL